MAVNFFWFGGFFSAYFVGKVLVIANGKPRLVLSEVLAFRIECSCFMCLSLIRSVAWSMT